MGQITQAEDVDDSAHGRREHGGQFERPSAALDKQGALPQQSQNISIEQHLTCVLGPPVQLVYVPSSKWCCIRRREGGYQARRCIPWRGLRRLVDQSTRQAIWHLCYCDRLCRCAKISLVSFVLSRRPQGTGI